MAEDNAQRYHFADFTHGNYRRLLRLAKSKRPLCTHADSRKAQRFILWRHDVDISPHAARRLAQIEAEEGIGVTYFWHLHNTFYNLLERETADIVKEIAALGHGVGLHFDADFYGIAAEEELAPRLRMEQQVLEDLGGQPVRCFSFHNPSRFTMNCQQWEYAGMVNTYAEHFQTQVAYCSDSNGYWRHERLEDVLTAGQHERLQVLTHPCWWQAEAMSPWQRVLRCIEGRASKTRSQYRQLLEQTGRKVIE